MVDNRDAIKTIERYDSSITLLYCDPPYVNAEQYYEASRHGFDHLALASALNQAQGYVALSYYQHDLLDQLYPAPKWRRMTWQQKKNCAIQENTSNDIGTELLLMNYPETFGGLFDERINP
jgi:DNA adenine methylase